MMLVLLAVGGLWMASRLQSGQTIMPLFTPKTEGMWAPTPPSTAGSVGTGQTSPLSAILGRLTANFGQPVPYVPLSGPGGATTSPAASGAPAGSAANTLLAAAPGTVPTTSPIRSDVSSLANPQFWWMQGPVDVAIMSDSVGGAMAGASSLDLSPIMLEASMGMVL